MSSNPSLSLLTLHLEFCLVVSCHTSISSYKIEKFPVCWMWNRFVERFAFTENQLRETAEAVTNISKSPGSVEICGDTLMPSKISARATVLNDEMSGSMSTVATDHMVENVADLSSDSDSADVFVDDVNRTFTLTSPFVLTTCEQEVHSDNMTSSLMSAHNPQQLMSAASAAGEQHVPASGLPVLDKICKHSLKFIHSSYTRIYFASINYTFYIVCYCFVTKSRRAVKR